MRSIRRVATGSPRANPAGRCTGRSLRISSAYGRSPTKAFGRCAGRSGTCPTPLRSPGCRCWIVDGDILQERWQDARGLFDRLLQLRNDVGLLSEEYDPRAGRLVGNFPQAFTHVALINSAFNLTRFEKPADQRARAATG